MFPTTCTYRPCQWDKMAAIFFFSSRVKLKKLIRAPWPPRVPRIPNAKVPRERRSHRERHRHQEHHYLGSQATSSGFFLRFQILHFFCKILKSYMTSGQCYEGNSFLIALPFSFIPCWSRFLEENNSYRHTCVGQISLSKLINFVICTQGKPWIYEMGEEMFDLKATTVLLLFVQVGNT